MFRILRFDVAGDSTPDRHELATSPLSRRAALRRLTSAGLGIAGVAAGMVVLDPAPAAAKPKRRAKRRKAQPRRLEASVATKIPPDVVAPDPVVADPGVPPDSTYISRAHLSVKRWRRGWKVRVEVEFHFGEADRAVILQGGRGRLTCEIWENDDNAVTSVNPHTDTFVFAFPGVLVPSGGPPKRGPRVFEKWASRNTLDLDRPNPDADEIIGLLTLTTPSGQLVSRATNMVKVIRYPD